MKIMLSETVTKFHEVELSDELNIENILDMASVLKSQCDSGCEALETVLEGYKNQFGEAFDYKITPNAGGQECETLNYEYIIEE